MRLLFRSVIPASCLFASALLLVGPAMAASKDAFVGTWVLDPDHSQFTPGPGPTNRTMTFEMKANGLHHLTKTINNNGGLSTIDYTAEFDNHDYPVEGAAIDTVSLKRDSPMEIERTGKVHGVATPAESCMMKVSPDGKTLTMTIKGDYRGTKYASTQLYKRQ